ncbi:MAG: hypothetical protein Phog2KO_41580 [Phototrophicaceae bacterium]
MDKLRENIETILYEEVQSYVTSAYKGKLYFNISEDESLYSVIFVPDENYPVKAETDIVIAARIINGYVSIEKDTTDKPLYKELIRRGVLRENIILKYAGEKLEHIQ